MTGQNSLLTNGTTPNSKFPGRSKIQFFQSATNRFFLPLYGELLGFARFIKSGYSFGNKIKILSVWIKINLKYIFCRFKKENILGFEIRAFDYGAIKFLFEEIFLKAQYFIELKIPNPVIFDCGANIGLATIFFKWMYPGSQIFAFEPDKPTFELLKYNIEINKLSGVNLFNFALSDKKGKIDFFVDGSRQGALVMSENFNAFTRKKTLADSILLSQFLKDRHIQKIDLIKMDIEGSEKKVIEDLDKNNLLENVLNFIIEYHHKIGGKKPELGKFLSILEKNNFEYQIGGDGSIAGFDSKPHDIFIYASLT